MEISVNKPELPTITKLRKLGDENGGTIIAAVHNGSWHADDVLSVAILREALPEYNFSVIRSRDPEILRRAHIVLDVGNGEFDHHSPGKPHYPNGIPYAACGLVLEAVEPDRTMINYLNWELIYAVSAKDNGYVCPTQMQMAVNKLDWVGSFYPTWQERSMTEGELLTRFYHVLDMVQDIYRRCRIVCRARIDAAAALSKCSRYAGRFIELPRGGLPWQKYGYENTELLGAVYQDDSTNNWVVRLAKERDGVCTRVSFPAEWGGLEDKVLQSTSRIPDALFCHKGLHMATFKTRAGAEVAMRTLIAIWRYERHQTII